MKSPKYLIKDVCLYTPKNAAQHYVCNLVQPLTNLTLADGDVLKEFESYIGRIVKSAHELYPRCKEMVARSYSIQKEIKISIVVPSNRGESQYLAIITISVIPGEWKGGLL